MTGQELYRKAKTLIPGGTQLLSKRPELFSPERWPAYYREARGCEVWDLEGTRFVDMSLMGVGACVLGYGDPDVDTAVKAAVDRGVMCTLNTPDEVELAETLTALHPWSEMVRFARTGGEAMAIAVRLARAATGRDVVAFCGYHGWSDWYLAGNLTREGTLDGHLLPGLEPAGVPRSLAGTAYGFHYNRISEFRQTVAEVGNRLAAVVMEPQRSAVPAAGFLEEIRETTRRIGAVLVFDEITTGFRNTNGGTHLLLGIQPDIATFAKAMSNGYAMAAVIGRRAVMEAATRTFVSSTYWTEAVGPAAALATIQKIESHGVPEHLARIGSRVMDGWRREAAEAGLTIEIDGQPSLAHFSFQSSEAQRLTTFFTERMLDRGYLAYCQFKPSLAHSEEIVDRYLEAVREVFEEISGKRPKASDRETQEAQPGFYRLA